VYDDEGTIKAVHHDEEAIMSIAVVIVLFVLASVIRATLLWRSRRQAGGSPRRSANRCSYRG
jgi:hypothetical protein